MRHSAITLSEQVAQRSLDGEEWDILFCSDMLSLAEFRGLVPEPVRSLPSIVYFHENQVTYPVQHEKEYDYHFAFSNMTSALAADQVWFNSQFHCDDFLTGLGDFLRRMPDYQPLDQLNAIRSKASIHPPGIDSMPTRGKRRDGPIRILWAARWEHDKNPECFFDAVDILHSEGVDFRLSVIGGGESRQILPVFEDAHDRFKAHVDHWGYQETIAEYHAVLAEADVIVSTADHEFFGIGIVEAVAAGVFPLVPNRLAYPEVLAHSDAAEKISFLYDGSTRTLAARLADLAQLVEKSDLWQGDAGRGIRTVDKFRWDSLVPVWDAELLQLCNDKVQQQLQ